MNRTTVKEYQSRINRTFDYIEKNLWRQLTLDELAEAANFSRYHFNRLFHALVGETPFQFINRVRLEKAASLLILKPGDSVSAIACQCGFSDLSIFSRNFKTYFGASPSFYRKNKGIMSNMSQTNSNILQPSGDPSPYFCLNTNQIKWRTEMELNKSIEITDLPQMTVAYIRHVGPYQGDSQLFERLWGKLFAWAGPRGLIGGPGFKSLIIYHDDPNITDDQKLRMSVCITVPPVTKTDNEVGKMNLEGGKYVIARFDLDATQFGEAWQWLYASWFPASGYQPDDKPCFEMYPEEPKDGRFIVDICVPVKPI